MEKKSVDHRTSFQYHPHKAVMPHGHKRSAALKQASAQPGSGSCSTFIIKFSAGGRVTHLHIKSNSRQTHKVLPCRHAGCFLQDLCISTVGAPPPASRTETEGAAPISVGPLQRSSIHQRCEATHNRQTSLSSSTPVTAGACLMTVQTC